MAMQYVVNGQGTDSATCHELLARNSQEMVRAAGLLAVLTMRVESAFFSYGSEQEKYKPMLNLVGRPMTLRGNFPCDIVELNYTTPQDRSLMVYRYTLGDDDMVSLIHKGFYKPTFEIPNIIKHNDFELPCRVTFVGLPAQLCHGARGDYMEPPLAFASIESDSCICDEHSPDPAMRSGYTLRTYFKEASDEMGPRYFDDEDELNRGPDAQAPALTGAEFERGIKEATEELRRDMPESPVLAGSGEAEAGDVAEKPKTAPVRKGSDSVSDLPDIEPSDGDRQNEDEFI